MTLAYPQQTHVMVPRSLKDRLKDVSRATRVPMSHFHREAVRHVLSVPWVEPGGAGIGLVRASRAAESGLVNLVFRLGDPELHEGLRELSERTHVGVGEYMRLGLEYVVTKWETARDAA